MKIIEKNYDALTGKTTITERDETPNEKAHREKLEAEATTKAAELAAKAQARQALLNKLGLTEEEARLLLGGN